MALRRTDRAGFARVQKIGTRFEGVTVGTTYGTPALKVGGKMFCCVPIHRSAEPGSLAIRMDFFERDLRIKAKPKTYYTGAHYENYPCVLARLAKLSDAELRELLEVGWHFAKAKRRRT